MMIPGESLRKRRSARLVLPFLAITLAAGALIGVITSLSLAQTRSDPRDRNEQPLLVIESTGVKPGMVVGEVGAGSGYFTFRLARAVGFKGQVYANDIVRSGLDAIDGRSAAEGITNIETVLGTVDDPRFPKASLDMVFMINSFHEFEKPVELLANLLPSLKPDATVVIMDRDPKRSGSSSGHFPTQEQVAETISRSVFELVRIETFLRYHNLYILKARKQ